MTTAAWRGRAATAVVIGAFVSCIAVSNWALLHLGVVHGPGEPRTIPLGFGLHTPSGVVFAGALLTLRDVIHERIGQVGTLVVIAASTPVAALASSTTLALASAITFLLAELADFAVYIRVRRRGRAVAVVTSNIVSGILDSVVFLSIAFGVTSALHGAPTMTVGKLVASLLTFGVLTVVGRSTSWHHDAPPNAARHDAAQASPG